MSVSTLAGRVEQRAEVIFEFGGSLEAAQELLHHLTPPSLTISAPTAVPLISELHVEAWQRYLSEAESIGVFAALRSVLPQLQFPIRGGISETAEYRAATRQGKPNTQPDGLALEHPESLGLRLVDSLAGALPVLLPQGRHDFVALVRALAHKNEPVELPETMESCLIRGYINWDRIRLLRHQWEDSEGGAFPDAYHDAQWAQEFREHILPHKALYQDTVLILGDGDYSGVSADQIGVGQDHWRDLSRLLRQEYGITRYLLRRLSDAEHTHPLIEDLACEVRAIATANHRYTADWLLRCMGFDGDAPLREGSRLAAYVQEVGLSDQAARILQSLIRAAAVNLEAYLDQRPALFAGVRADIPVLALCTLSLEALASPAYSQHLDHALSKVQSGR